MITTSSRKYAATKLAARTYRRPVRYRGSPSHVAWPELENPPNAEWFGGGVKKLSEESPGHRPNAHAQRPSVARIRPDNFLTPAAGDFHPQILILSHIGRACGTRDGATAL